MKIVHVAPSCVYTEGWGYQDNLLPKYQAKLGHEVYLIVPTEAFCGTEIQQTEEERYISPDGFFVIRKSPKRLPIYKVGEALRYIEVYDELLRIEPDMIFYHGMVSYTIVQAVKYKKRHPACIIVQDNHLDYNIGFRTDTLRKKLLSAIYTALYRYTDRYIDKVYGVTPWRKQYAEEVFGVPKSKTDVLIMGADDEKINFRDRLKTRAALRCTYGFGDTDFVIVSGGKIDEKKKILPLMDAVNSIGENVYLLIFGSPTEEIKTAYRERLSEYVRDIGWINADTCYEYFFMADLAFFPGQHSVLWEQACASKVPCVFRLWDGMEHVNNGGNADFIRDASVEAITEKIRELRFTDKYARMKSVAESDRTDIYLYSNIAKKSLELLETLNKRQTPPLPQR